jgi:hypothetical protein
VVADKPNYPIGRAGARGAIAAMAMTGLRRLSTTAGLVERTPPERVLHKGVPELLSKLPSERRAVVVEAAHVTYGTTGGMLFGVLPRRLRQRHRWWLGPAYGMLFWTAYEAVIAPVLGLSHGKRPVAEKVALLTDHILYGVIVAAAPWPYRD